MTAAVVNTPAAWTERSRHDTSWGAALWSERGQVARFQAVVAHLDLRAGDSLLDFGCGTGRMSAFVPSDVDYFGLDSSPGMLARARREHPEASFLSEIPESLFDHVVAVGPFNLPGSLDDTFGKLSELWHETVRRSLVVSLYRGDDAACLRYDPVVLAAWAKALGAPRYAIDASYLDNDVILAAWR